MVVVRIGRVFVGFTDWNKNAFSKRFGHVTVSEDGK